MSELGKLRQFEDKNGRLKRSAADLTLDKQILQEALSKKRPEACTEARAGGVGKGEPPNGQPEVGGAFRVIGKDFHQGSPLV